MNAAPLLNRLPRAAALGLLAVALAACASTYDPGDEDRSRVTSVVTPGTTLRAGSTFGVLSDSRTLGDRPETGAVDGVIRDAMVRLLQQRGLHYVGTRSKEADMWVGYVAAESGDLDARELVQRFGLAMGPDAFLGGVAEGTVLVVLMDGRTGHTLWRASTQAQLRRVLPLEERAKRIQHHIGRLFSTCPPTSGS